ncbi:MAG: protein phosphatase 2C domain-containing protein [Proteobacteria bacterium]|nr:protein phosphatase 2C domain-containing protein [Pseudomonadota bacterium]
MIEAYGLTDVGKKRKRNEDCVLINKKLSLFIVADGMGGHSLGNYASNTTASTINTFIEKEISSSNSKDLKKDEFIFSLLKSAVQTANTEIFKRSQSLQEKITIGATVSMTLMRDSKIYIAHVGDSSIYRLRSGVMEKLTKDDSVVQGLIEEGKISEEEAKNHKLSNIITKAVGSSASIEPFIGMFDMNDRDIYLLSSDGLTKMLDVDVIKGILAGQGKVKDKCSTLLGEVLQRGALDNVSIIIIEFGKKDILKRIFSKIPGRA